MSSKTMMKAINFATTPISVIDIPKPTPKENEVLIKVDKAAIDTALHDVVSGEFFAPLLHAKKTKIKNAGNDDGRGNNRNKDSLLFTLGWHYAGTIEQVGEGNVSDFQQGDAVFGFLQYDPSTTQGSFSQYITVHHTECGKKPSNVNFDVAAASATEAITALMALRDKGQLKPGQRVLILGGGGGVGSAAVQIAKRVLGASQVTVTCSTRDVENVKAWGADKVIDRTKIITNANHSDLRTEFSNDDTFHVIFDTTGHYKANEWLGKLDKNDGGYFVATIPSFSLMWGKILGWFRGNCHAVGWVMAKCTREDIELVGDWLASGKLVIPIDSMFKAKDMEKAMARQSERSQRKGRVVIDVAQEDCF